MSLNKRERRFFSGHYKFVELSTLSNFCVKFQRRITMGRLLVVTRGNKSREKHEGMSSYVHERR